jgi:hypothetical protein
MFELEHPLCSMKAVDLIIFCTIYLAFSAARPIYYIVQVFCLMFCVAPKLFLLL